MDNYTKIATKNDITQGYPKVVELGGFEIVLFKVNEEIFAIENICPHQHFGLFHQGTVEGNDIVCPMHGWSFDLRTGKAVEGSGRVKTFEVRIDGDAVLLKDFW